MKKFRAVPHSGALICSDKTSFRICSQNQLGLLTYSQLT